MRGSGRNSFPGSAGNALTGGSRLPSSSVTAVSDLAHASYFLQGREAGASIQCVPRRSLGTSSYEFIACNRNCHCGVLLSIARMLVLLANTRNLMTASAPARDPLGHAAHRSLQQFVGNRAGVSDFCGCAFFCCSSSVVTLGLCELA